MSLTGTLQFWIKKSHNLLRAVHAEPLVHGCISCRSCISFYFYEVAGEARRIARQIPKGRL
jgi:hypothetical protein